MRGRMRARRPSETSVSVSSALSPSVPAGIEGAVAYAIFGDTDLERSLSGWPRH
jgi:hypothetical protein